MSKRFYLIFILFFFSISCSKSPLFTGRRADKNLIRLASVRKNMTKYRVKKIVGRPYKIETKTMNNTKYLVLYYVTKEVSLAQTEFINKNLTPLVFYNNRLIGMGYSFYNYFFDINDAKKMKKEEERQKYINDRDEWPPNEHKIIVPEEDLIEKKDVEENNLQYEHDKEDLEDYPLEKLLKEIYIQEKEEANEQGLDEDQDEKPSLEQELEAIQDKNFSQDKNLNNEEKSNEIKKPPQQEKESSGKKKIEDQNNSLKEEESIEKKSPYKEKETEPGSVKK